MSLPLLVADVDVVGVGCDSARLTVGAAPSDIEGGRRTPGPRGFDIEEAAEEDGGNLAQEPAILGVVDDEGPSGCAGAQHHGGAEKRALNRLRAGCDGGLTNGRWRLDALCIVAAVALFARRSRRSRRSRWSSRTFSAIPSVLGFGQRHEGLDPECRVAALLDPNNAVVHNQLAVHPCRLYDVDLVAGLTGVAVDLNGPVLRQI